MKKRIYVTLLLFALIGFSVFSQVADKAEGISPILIGETLPNATLYNANNEGKSVAEIINKPTVLIFYRGSWCPYCNVHLSELVKIEADILKMGYQIVAVSPDDFQNLDETTEKIKINYQLYSDKNADFIKALGIGFKVPEKSRAYITTKTKGNTTEVLPVPTVLILNNKQEILMEYISPNFKKRLSSKLLLALLEGLGEEQ
ncbi:MAG: peroxiredoxin-like family protein [Spirosomataceae bacterium]